MYLSYNGFTNLRHVNIESYTLEPVYAEDGISQITTKHELSGTALVRSDTNTDAAFTAELLNAQTLLTRPRGDLRINLNDAAASSDTDIVNLSGPDEGDGPQGQFRIQRIFGIRAALVTFTVRWWKFQVASGEGTNGQPFHVLSHRWTQKYFVDQRNMVTQTIAGTLTVRANAAPTPPGTIAPVHTNLSGNNPDAYRLLVTPPLPEGFRRESMEFGIDETGNRLLYTIVNIQVARNLPWPARTGNASFYYKQDLKDSLLGTKVFEIELEGGTWNPPRPGGSGGNNVLAELLTAAVRLSSRFIKYAGQGGDLVQSTEVGIVDLLTSNKIRYRVVAKGTGGTGVGGSDQNGVLTPPNVNLISDWFAASGDQPPIPGYTDVSPYGSALIQALRREFYRPIDSSVPQADFTFVSTQQAATTDYQVPAEVFDVLSNDIVPESSNVPNGATQEHLSYPFTYVNSVDRIEIVDTGLRCMKPQSLHGSDIVMQVYRPRVMLVQTVEITRIGLPPNIEMHSIPFGGILLSNKSSTATGNIDANGNISFTARAERVVELCDINNTVGWSTYVDQTVYDLTLRRFTLPTDDMMRPHDPRITANPNFSPMDQSPETGGTIGFYNFAPIGNGVQGNG